MKNKIGQWTKTFIGVGGLWLCVQSTTAWGATAASTEAAAAAIEPAQQSPTKETQTFANTYAQREKAAPNQQNFEGGGAGLYIGGSTVAIVLLVVLLIVVL